ncbi:MAG: acetate/propionate family kinase, partial [Nannocystaceae bacterium]
RALGSGSAGELLPTLLPELLALAPDSAAGPVGAVGHRVVHGGERFVAPTRVDDEVEAAIERLEPLAPLHNPANLAGIRAARAVCPGVPHVAVFDTAFHSTLPSRARNYALPQSLTRQHGIRRYGFHGTSHAWVAQRAAAFLGEPLAALRLITCHLGNGASVAAVEYGRSVETSMGMTPLEGLVMGTRSGDVDPGVLLHLMRAEGLDVDGLDAVLNGRSGLQGLSGVGHDMRDIEDRAAAGDDRCRLAMRVFAHRLRKYIGAYAAVMGGVDAVVFTGGIGEGSAEIRHMASQRLEFLGARLDEDRNRQAEVSARAPVFEISEHHGRVRLLVVATDEGLAIAQQAAALAAQADRVETVRTIPVAVSARHIHLTQPMVERLFGPGHRLTPRKELSQPGQFACEETLTVIGPKRSLEQVRVLGPVRRRNQVEISRTDEFWLGVDAPVRNSGDVANSPGVTLEGPAGRVTLDEGLICAARHIHMTPADAQAFGVSDGDVVEVAIDSEGRDLVFGDVLIRVSPKYRLEMHVDTDEANAAQLTRHAEGMLVSSSGQAHLRRRRLRSGDEH